MRGFIPDPYEVLGIARDATQREVKQACHRLAMNFHPDHNPEKPEAEERFKQIQQAYDILTGRKKPGRRSPAAFYRRRHPPTFFANQHTFFSFYQVMRIHGDRIVRNMKSNHQDSEKRDDDERKRAG